MAGLRRMPFIGSKQDGDVEFFEYHVCDHRVLMELKGKFCKQLY